MLEPSGTQVFAVLCVLQVGLGGAGRQSEDSAVPLGAESIRALWSLFSRVPAPSSSPVEAVPPHPHLCSQGLSHGPGGPVPGTRSRDGFLCPGSSVLGWSSKESAQGRRLVRGGCGPDRE